MTGFYSAKTFYAVQRWGKYASVLAFNGGFISNVHSHGLYYIRISCMS